MGFTRHVYQFLKEDSPEGDFARDWKRDSNKPRVTKLETLERYLILRGACYGAVNAARSLFNKYIRN